MEKFVVITEDGLAMWAPLPLEDSQRIAEKRTPSGKQQFAVPERVAKVVGLAREELGRSAARRLQEDRIKTTKLLLAAYDDTKQLV